MLKVLRDRRRQKQPRPPRGQLGLSSSLCRSRAEGLCSRKLQQGAVLELVGAALFSKQMVRSAELGSRDVRRASRLDRKGGGKRTCVIGKVCREA